jgi:hypothetical protein
MGIGRHLHFPVEAVPQALAIQDRIDVGVSDPLQTGLGFFDPRSSPCRLPWACLAVGLPWNSQGGINFQRLFHIPRSSQDGLGPLCTPAVLHSRCLQHGGDSEVPELCHSTCGLVWATFAMKCQIDQTHFYRLPQREQFRPK